MRSYYRLVRREKEKDGTQISTYFPTEHTQGAWNPKEQHMAPATGVICSELEQFQPRENMQIGRISLDIYGIIHRTEFTITTRIIRPGRTIELIESILEANGRTCIAARTWRMITQDTTAVKGLEEETLPSPAALPYWKGMTIWGGGYIDSVKEHIKIAERRPGKGKVWISNDLEMVEGQPTSSFVKLMGMVDTMNGLVVRQERKFTHAFPNVDLQIHLYRIPSGKWLGLDVQQQYGADGIGLTSAVLHDEKGPFGQAVQILTVRSVVKKS